MSRSCDGSHSEDKAGVRFEGSVHGIMKCSGCEGGLWQAYMCLSSAWKLLNLRSPWRDFLECEKSASSPSQPHATYNISSSMSFIPSNVRELPIGVPYIDEDAETDSIKVKSGFCTKCRDALLCVNRGPGTRDEVLAGRKATRKQYYTRTSAMQFAAGAGCKLCILFLTTLETISSTSFRDWTDPVGGLIWVYHAERKNEKWIYAHLGIDVELEEAEDWRMERVRVVWWRTHGELFHP